MYYGSWHDTNYKTCAECNTREPKIRMKIRKGSYFCSKCYGQKYKIPDPHPPKYYANLEDNFTENNDNKVPVNNYTADLEIHTFNRQLFGVSVYLKPEHRVVKIYKPPEPSTAIMNTPDGSVVNEFPNEIKSEEITCESEKITITPDYDDGSLEAHTEFLKKLEGLYWNFIKQASWTRENEYDQWVQLLHDAMKQQREKSPKITSSKNNNEKTDNETVSDPDFIINLGYGIEIPIPYAKLIKNKWPKIKSAYVYYMKNSLWI
jgi:hypothetical protein